MTSTVWKDTLVYLIRVAMWYLVILVVMAMDAPYEGWSDFVLIGMGAVCLHEILVRHVTQRTPGCWHRWRWRHEHPSTGKYWCDPCCGGTYERRGEGVR